MASPNSIVGKPAPQQFGFWHGDGDFSALSRSVSAHSVVMTLSRFASAHSVALALSLARPRPSLAMWLSRSISGSLWLSSLSRSLSLCFAAINGHSATISATVSLYIRRASSSGGRSTLHRGLVSLTTSKDVLGTQGWESTINSWLSTSDVGRTGLLQGGNVCGLSVFTKQSPGNTLSLSHGALPHLLVGASERVIGNLSTNPQKDQPGSVDGKAIKLYVTVMPAASAVGLPFPQGPPFQGNKFAGLKAALNLDGRSTYVIVAAPVSFPTPWGIPSVARGDLDFEIENLFEIMHDPTGKAYLRAAEQHTVTKGEAILTHAVELASVLPNGISSLSLVADPFCSFVPLTPEEQENTYESECKEHSLRLQAYLQPPVAPVPVVVTGGGDGASTVGGVLDMSVAGNDPASPVQPSVKMNIRRTAFASLMYGRARLDPTSGQVQFVPATLQPECTAALMQTDASIASSAFSSCVTEHQTLFNGDRDYLCHPARLEAMKDPVVIGWALHAEGSPTNYDSMDEFVGQNEGLSILHFLPDSKAVASKRRKANAASAARKNQQYQGEDAKNLNKLSTTAVVMDHIGSLRQINIVLSNCSLLAHTFAKFDRSKNESDAPLLHKLAYEVSDLLNDRVFLTWYEDLDEKRRIPFLYWLIHELNSILQKLLALAKVERNIQHFVKKEFASIIISPWTAAEDSISAVCNKIHGLASGTSTEIPETKIFRTSSLYSKWEKQKLEAQSREIKLKLEQELRQQLQSQKRLGGPLVTPGGDDKRPRGWPVDPDAIPAPSTPRTLGEIVWDRSLGSMPIPTPHKREWGPQLCLSHIESSNSGCRLGHFCKYHHPPAITNWNPHMVSAWKDLVSKTDGMSWNSQLAPNM
eukprot:scaffold27225_cov80-Skeletonema_dohrnii-CCMP3373.AAC.4